MVLVGKGSKCALCGDPIGSAPIATLKHFIRNRSDCLAPFSGRVFHKKCFNNHPLAKAALEFSQRRAEYSRSRANCEVCGRAVTADGLTTDLLASEKDNPLFDFNFTCFHSEHVDDWTDLEKFRNVLDEATRTGRWEGKAFIRYRPPQENHPESSDE